MSQNVHVDTEQLRWNAQRVKEENAERPSSPSVSGGVGGARAISAFNEFDGYWSQALRAVSDSVVSLGDALESAADVYERRDVDSAQSFSFGAPRAF